MSRKKLITEIITLSTGLLVDKQVKNALREFGISEDAIQQQNFKYG